MIFADLTVLFINLLTKTICCCKIVYIIVKDRFVMKKLLAFLFSLLLLFTLAGCMGDVKTDGSKADETNARVATDTVGVCDDGAAAVSGGDAFSETTGVSDTTGHSKWDDEADNSTEPCEPILHEETETSPYANVTTFPEGMFETVVTDEAGTEWVVGSSLLFGGETEAAVEVPETEAVLPETEVPETESAETEEPEIEEPEIEEPFNEKEETEDPEEDAETDPDTGELDVPEGDSPTTYPTVLMYHCVNEEPYTVNTALFVRPTDLRQQFQLIQMLGIETLFADEFGPVHKNSVILTFDDGYEDNYYNMFPLAKKYNIKVTIFIIAYMIDSPGYLTTEQMQEMAASGLVQFGSHTLDHPSLINLSPEGIREQFAGASWIIYNKTGQTVNAVAYPSGDYNSTVMDIASEYYDFAYTTDAVAYWGQDNMMLPRYAILRDTTIYGFRAFIE